MCEWFLIPSVLTLHWHTLEFQLLFAITLCKIANLNTVLEPNTECTILTLKPLSIQRK